MRSLHPLGPSAGTGGGQQQLHQPGCCHGTAVKHKTSGLHRCGKVRNAQYLATALCGGRLTKATPPACLVTSWPHTRTVACSVSLPPQGSSLPPRRSSNFGPSLLTAWGCMALLGQAGSSSSLLPPRLAGLAGHRGGGPPPSASSPSSSSSSRRWWWSCRCSQPMLVSLVAATILLLGGWLPAGSATS